MADTKPAAPRKDDSYTVRNDSGAIPRMGMTIPMPAGTKPPPAPSPQSSAKPAGPK